MPTVDNGCTLLHMLVLQCFLNNFKAARESVVSFLVNCEMRKGGTNWSDRAHTPKGQTQAGNRAESLWREWKVDQAFPLSENVRVRAVASLRTSSVV